MSGLRVASRGERECLDGRSSSSEQRHVGGLPNEQRPGTCVSGAVTLPAHQAWPVGAFMPRCGGSAGQAGGGQCYGRHWREALDSWLSERGGCQWRVWERSTARSQRRGWGKDEGLAVI